jgi:RHS repeat-associated protein
VVRSKSGTLSTDFLFTGEQFDAEARPAGDLYYLRARYYDPSTGRLLTRDPFAGFMPMPQSLSRYGYALKNPANLVDPLVRCGLTDPAGCAKAVVTKGGDVMGGAGDVIGDPAEHGVVLV